MCSILHHQHHYTISTITGVEPLFPTNIVPVVTLNGVSALKWGFPQWKGNGVIINARAETALEKSMFRKPMLEHRCAVPCTGYFEWRQIEGRKKKDKYFLTYPGGGVLYLAGAYGRFRDANGEYDAFVVLTTDANDSVSAIHSRMPVIISAEEREAWLGDTSFMEHVLSRTGPVLSLNPI